VTTENEIAQRLIIFSPTAFALSGIKKANPQFSIFVSPNSLANTSAAKRAKFYLLT
jgi:hypothetical protein